MNIEKSTHYSVTHNGDEYIRFGEDCWYQYYGSSLEPVSDCTELDKLFINTYSHTNEIADPKCYCGNPVDMDNPDCVQFGLCNDHQLDA